MHAKLVSEKIDLDFNAVLGLCANGKAPYLNCKTGSYPWY